MSMQRGVQWKQGISTKIECPSRGCAAVLYTLQDNEILGRSRMPGRLTVERECLCPECGQVTILKVQVRR